MRLVAATFFVAVCGTFSAAADASLSSSLKRQMRAAGAYSGAYVVDSTTGRRLFSWRSGASRILASNTKLFSTSALLARMGPDATFETQVLAHGQMNDDGILKGDLWLRGGGDPAFGTRSYVRRHFGRSAAAVEDLAEQLADSGLVAVRGGVHGDESAFDSIRGVHDSRYGVSPWVGPLSALSFNHAYDSHGFQSNPPTYAAGRLRKALDREDIAPGHAAASGKTPDGAVVMATVQSAPVGTLIRLTNKDSDNFFAETLLKDLGREAYGTGSTAAGVRAAMAHAAQAGARVQMIDGSGLDHGDRASPRDVVRLLAYERTLPGFQFLFDSLPVAGVDGTLDDRMNRGPAHRNCRAKTGSLIGVSTLSGYCTSRSGHTLTFSFLMNGISTSYARRLQDRMAQALAGWRG
jgi:D-alanyl-D-alanine carboxypeptidase/D-alanyl-D-alanine-endopeptidase (penicillin-binding protein 4)